nr:hypothetical protein [Bacteroidota bacterium]
MQTDAVAICDYTVTEPNTLVAPRSGSSGICKNGNDGSAAIATGGTALHLLMVK